MVKISLQVIRMSIKSQSVENHHENLNTLVIQGYPTRIGDGISHTGNEAKSYQNKGESASYSICLLVVALVTLAVMVVPLGMVMNPSLTTFLERSAHRGHAAERRIE
jgi:hypothetical protein